MNIRICSNEICGAKHEHYSLGRVERLELKRRKKKKDSLSTGSPTDCTSGLDTKNVAGGFGLHQDQNRVPRLPCTLIILCILGCKQS